jgi:hypothetical protein
LREKKGNRFMQNRIGRNARRSAGDMGEAHSRGVPRERGPGGVGRNQVEAAKCRSRAILALVMVCWLGKVPLGSQREACAQQLQVVPKWSRFEQAFESAVKYTNALQQAELIVTFVSPLGETQRVHGFWDGARTWRARFSPDQTGRWTFSTACSDPANPGLDKQEGSFLCSSALGQSRFREHGPVRIARDLRHFEHADGTPFFWLADGVGSGARLSEPADWERYAETRASQSFTVSEWSVVPGADNKRQAALTGYPDRIGINPDFFKRLDAKLENLSRQGILCAITPLSELETDSNLLALPDDQVVLLLRYAVARWGSEPVAWVLAFDGDSQKKMTARWKRIGQAVIGAGPHAPVILYPGRSAWLLDEFRDQTWVDAFGYQTVTDASDDALKWAFAGPFASEWSKEPARPIIPFAPCENGFASRSRNRFSSDDVRHALYWGLLMTVPAGVSYCGQGVMNWDKTVDRNEKGPGADLPLWQRSLFLPAAKQMGCLASLFNSTEFWRLQPQPKVIANQPGDSAPQSQVAAAATADKALSVIYVPQGSTLQLNLESLPPSFQATWLNPRTGEDSPANPIMSERMCRFSTPDASDWVLMVRTK